MPAVRTCGNRVAKGASQTHVVINRGNARAEDWAWSSLRWQVRFKAFPIQQERPLIGRRLECSFSSTLGCKSRQII